MNNVSSPSLQPFSREEADRPPRAQTLPRPHMPTSSQLLRPFLSPQTPHTVLPPPSPSTLYTLLYPPHTHSPQYSNLTSPEPSPRPHSYPHCPALLRPPLITLPGDDGSPGRAAAGVCSTVAGCCGDGGGGGAVVVVMWQER